MAKTICLIAEKGGVSRTSTTIGLSGLYASQGAKVLEIDLAIGPVHILDQEDLSTPAGGFPCVAMAYELWVTQLVRKRFRLRDWFAPTVGVIRREVFDRNGKFFGYCELVEFLPG